MDAVDEIKGRLSIEDVVERYVDLKRAGSSLKGLCPFHQEKTPSFVVTPSRGSYHCFGCGKGGDIFSFVMEMEHVPFPDALGRLAEQAGVPLPEREANKPSLKNRLFEANEAAARAFTELLKTDAGRRARTYLEKRQFGPDAILAFDIGVAPEGRDVIVRRLREAGIEDRFLVDAGLALQDEASGELRDRFRGRLMFPIRDAEGRITGFGGRTLTEAQPKYLNSPQTEIFDKSSVLFGVHRSRDAIRSAGRAVLVEGYLDAVRAHVSGFSNVVASLGTAVTRQQLAVLSRLTSTVVLALDPDAAGQSAAARASLDSYGALLQGKGRVVGSEGSLDLRISLLPAESGDPDELIRDDPARWSEIVAASRPALDVFFDQTLAALDRSTDTWRQTALERLLPVIQQFGGSADIQPRWIERLSKATHADPRFLQQAMLTASGRPGRRPSRRSAPASQPRSSARDQSNPVAEATSRALTRDNFGEVESRLLAVLLKLVVIPADAADLLNGWQFSRSEHAALVEALLAWRHNNNYDYELFREHLSPDLQQISDTLHSLEEPVPVPDLVPLAVAYYLARLRLLDIEGRLRRSSDALQSLPPEDRTAALSSVAELMEERRETEQALNRLSQRVVQGQALGRPI